MSYADIIVKRRRFHDEFHYDLLERCKFLCDQYKINCTIFYNNIPLITSTDLGIKYKKNIIILLPDNIHMYVNTIMLLAKSKFNILILTAVDKISLDLNFPKNISIIHYGGDILFGQNDWPTIEPQKKKNFTADYHWVSLTHITRVHRLFTAAYLLGQNLGLDSSKNKTGLLRISNWEILKLNKNNWHDHIQTTGSSFNDLDIDNKIITQGFIRLKNGDNGGQPDQTKVVYPRGNLNNPENFNLRLRHLYCNSYVEIINETNCCESGIFVTEKYQTSVYGYNLPIIISSYGTVDYLRSCGFDVFDDVVDHSYDNIKNSGHRIMAAIDLNIRLLTDKKYAIDAWNSCVERMDKNYIYISQHMYQHFKSQFDTNFKVFLQTEWQNN